MALTNEQVDELENSLREIQRNIESAAQIVCGVTGADANYIYNRLVSSADDIGDLILGCYHLRPVT